jgi:hypothetical protein
VLELWRDLATADLHSAARFFDDRVRQAVRTRDFSRALADQRRDVEDAEPVVVGEEATPVGTLVTLEAYESDSPPTRYSYLLRRNDGRWLIVFDTLTQSALRGRVQNRTQSRLDPKPGRPSARAASAGASAAERYRAAVLAFLGRGP